MVPSDHVAPRMKRRIIFILSRQTPVQNINITIIVAIDTVITVIVTTIIIVVIILTTITTHVHDGHIRESIHRF